MGNSGWTVITAMHSRAGCDAASPKTALAFAFPLRVRPDCGLLFCLIIHLQDRCKRADHREKVSFSSHIFIVLY